MRLSRSKPDPLDPGPAGYAHRGLHDGLQVPENTLIAFAAALDRGAGIECDLRLTADDRIVVFHDSDATRLCGTRARISRSGFDDLQALRIGDQPIPTLDDLIQLVGSRAPMLLEVKVDRDVRRWIEPLGRALAGYCGPFGIMSFDPRISRLVCTAFPAMRRGLVIRNGLAALQRGLAIRLADPQFLSVERSALSEPWVERLRQRMPLYSWTIRTAQERAQAAVHADALIWESDGRPRN
jgi:glycerophosphoryl diester phosphodiesterase